MSDKLVLAGNSMSANATAVERKCLTGYRTLDECPTRQQFAAQLLTQNHKRNDIETLVAANYLLGKTNRNELI